MSAIGFLLPPAEVLLSQLQEGFAIGLHRSLREFSERAGQFVADQSHHLLAFLGDSLLI